MNGSHTSYGRLQNKVAIVTGASSGLGRAISLAYSREGAFVVCADLQPTAKSITGDKSDAATHELIQKNGGNAVFIKTDVGDSSEVQAMVAKAVEEFGRLDIMVNNAGIAFEGSSPLPIHETDDLRWDLTMRVNVRSVFLGCKYATAQFLKQSPHESGDRGWIINTASILGMVGLAGAPSYCAAKGAVIQLTRQVAIDYAPHRIHCNALCPGFTKTAMIKPMTDNETSYAQLLAAHPFRGLGEPEDIAKAAVFLASDDASWITGVPLPVDGGYVAQ
ncbi:MAG: hypothetical protein M1827_005249 [Pycnora praestabilis]|nr:MAG: hypothetical protein M1827_005249 [Pycnora praestabilis]